MSNLNLQSNVNLQSTQGETFQRTESMVTLTNTVALFQHLASAPPNNWVVIDKPLADWTLGGELISEEIPAGEYKINSRWQVITYDDESGTYSRLTFKPRPISDLMSQEERDSWWSEWVMTQIENYFPNWAPGKFGYWKLTQATYGIIPSSEVTEQPGFVQSDTGNGNGNGKRSVIPWLALAALAAGLLS